jgi:hypothetical protein
MRQKAMQCRGPIIWTALGLFAGIFVLADFLNPQMVLQAQTSVVASQLPGTSGGAPQKLLHLELGYIESIIVPRGSRLNVRVQDAVGKTVGEREVKTEIDAPPYRMDVPLKSAANLPLTVHATLVSVLGHEFFQTQQVGAAQIARAELVGIDMR